MPRDIAAAKAAARTEAFARRAPAHAGADAAQSAHLVHVLADHLGRPLAGYLPMRTEIDPLPAMSRAAGHGPVAVPVIEGRARPLRFRVWTPGCTLERGTFGAMIPAQGDWLVPHVLIVPLVAFTRAGARLGYGGGYYDRTLERLRAARPTLAIGYAFAAQEAADLPLEPVDQPLDLIVTEAGVIAP